VAIALLDWRVGADPINAADPELLGQLAGYRRERAVGEDLSQAEYLERVLWLRGDYNRPFPQPDWTETTIRTFTARDDVWMRLQGHAQTAGRSRDLMLSALLDRASPRYDPARALAMLEAGSNSSDWTRAANMLDGTYGPADPERAEALLLRAADSDENARRLLLPFLLPRLDHGNAAERLAAVEQLQRMALLTGASAERSRAALLPTLAAQLASPEGSVRRVSANSLTRYAELGTSAAVPLVLGWVRQALREGDAEEAADAWRSLARIQPIAPAGVEQLVQNAAVQSGGIVDGGTFDISRMSSIITDDDYPPHALRLETEGIVEAEVILAPNGLPVQLFVLRPLSDSIDAMLRRNVLRRLRVRDNPAFTGHYVRLRLPPIVFRICPNTSGTEAEMDGHNHGAYLVQQCPPPHVTMY
jgi:hypothetical protein